MALVNRPKRTQLVILNDNGDINYQVSSGNFKEKEGIKKTFIRYTTSFSPMHGLGYHINVYIHILIRKIKNYIKNKKNRIKIYTFIASTQNINSYYLPTPIYRHISSFILIKN